MRDSKDNRIQHSPIWLEEQLPQHACIHLFFSYVIWWRFVRPSVCQVSLSSGNTKRSKSAFLHSRPPQCSCCGESELHTNNCKILRLCLNSSKNYMQSAMRTLGRGLGRFHSGGEMSRMKGKRSFIKCKEVGHLSRANRRSKSPKVSREPGASRLERRAQSEESGTKGRRGEPVSHRCGVSFCLNSSGDEHTDSWGNLANFTQLWFLERFLATKTNKT